MSAISFVLSSIRKSKLYRTAPSLIHLRSKAAGVRARLKQRVLTLVGPTRRERDNQHTTMFLAWQLREDSVCIDIGAHSGEVLDLFLKYAPHARHIAFEPLPQFQTILATKYPHVTLFGVALGDETGEIEFAEVMDAPALSGLSTGHLPTQHEIRSHLVQVRKLDDLMPVDVKPFLIKIDVEGAEFAVLKGALETIRRSRPIILFEHQKTSAQRTGADTYGVTSASVHSLLVNDLGYKIFDIDGNGPLSVAELEWLVRTESSRNFVARPGDPATHKET